jgi:transcriptional regulator with XRE-family HTH domain
MTLRSLRKERKVSQDALSANADFDRTYPSLLERGLRGPTLAMIFRLAEALGVEPTRLVAETAERLREEV